MPRPLEHVRVLDLSRVLAGPWATQNLGDLGAEVLKVERPNTGDETRTWGPPWLGGDAGSRMSAYYLSVNRGKKSVAIDFAQPAGRELIRELALKSDVLVENFKAGDLARHGLAYEELRARHPRLVYCSVTGFGQEGPQAARPGYDFVFQAMGGLMSITGERDDRPGGGPQKVGIAVTDVMAGMYASLAIVAALVHRDRTGEGQHVDLALLDTIVAFGANQILSLWCGGQVPRRHGNAHANIVPYGVFEAADGPLVLAVGNDAQFTAFCSAAGAPELAEDPRFRTNPDRVRNRAVLLPEVERLVAARPGAAWIATLVEAGVPCGPIQDYAQVFDDPQVRRRGLRIETAAADGTPIPTVASPMRFSATPVEYHAPPRLGQHTRDVLENLLGRSAAEVDALAARGVIGLDERAR